jgi:hypothetical protein
VPNSVKTSRDEGLPSLVPTGAFPQHVYEVVWPVCVCVCVCAVLYPLSHHPAPVPEPDDGGWGTSRLTDDIIDYCDIPQYHVGDLTPANFFKEFYSKVARGACVLSVEPSLSTLTLPFAVQTGDYPWVYQRLAVPRYLEVRSIHGTVR